MCNIASSNYWHWFKIIVGGVAAGVAVFSYIKDDLVAAIFLTIITFVILGDAFMNWSKYKLLDKNLEELDKHNNDLQQRTNDLEAQNNTYSDENTKHKNENAKFSADRKNLEGRIGELKTLNTNHATSIDQLNDSNIYLSGEVDRLNEIEQKLKEQLTFLVVIKDNMQVENAQLKENVEKSNTILINSRKLINSLMVGGDDCKKFNRLFEQNVNNLADTEHMLSVLINGIREDMFDEIDEDGDGFLSIEEVRRHMQLQKIKTKKHRSKSPKHHTSPKKKHKSPKKHASKKKFRKNENE